MAHREVLPPLRGQNKAAPLSAEPQETSEYLNNVRPIDVLEQRMRIGQRPGLAKWGAGTLIGAAEQPVVAMCSVTTVTPIVT